MKEALGVVKTLMTREQQLDDALMSGVATALCAEFIEALKYLDGAEPYSEPCYGHLTDSIIREMGVPLVTGDIPGVAVILALHRLHRKEYILLRATRRRAFW